MKIKEKKMSLGRKARESILEYIRENKLSADDMLPSEAALVEMLGVSRHTVREALALLEQEKVIYKIQGKGTFVNKPPIQIESGLEKLESITEIIRKFGYNPGTKWVSIEERQPTQDMAEKLALSPGEKVVTFKRIRTASGKMAAFLIDTVPKKMLGQQVPEKMPDESMFKYFKENYNIIIEYAISDIMPAFPTKEMIDLLKVKKNQLFLLLHQIHYDKDGHAVFYSMDYFNPEVFKFKVNRTI